LIDNLLNAWPILLGWPALGVALLLSATGLLRGRAWWLMVAALLIVPMTAYVATGTGPSRLGLAAPVLLVVAGFALRARKIALAWLCWGCVMAMAVALAAVIFA
jgi:hypothetical protein